MINNLTSLFLRQFQKKWVFKKYQRKKILVIDKSINLGLSKGEFYQIQKNELNFLLLFELLFKKITFNKKILNLSFIESYYYLLISKINPKILIGHECDILPFKIKLFFPEKTLVLFQFASYNNIYKKAAKIRHLKHAQQTDGKIKVDYFCVFDEWHQNFFDYFETNFLITGSVKNNSIPEVKLSKKNDILIISEFREKIKSYHGTNNNVSTMRLSDVCISYISKIVNEYCKRNKRKISIAFVSNRNDKKHKGKDFRKNEIEFFKRDIENLKEENKDSITLAAESEMSICLASNLGPELLSRGEKVLFLNIHHFVLPWYFLPDKSGPFWYQGQNVEVIKDKIEHLLSLSESEWKETLDKHKIHMKFDIGNSILKKKIDDILNEKN